ncbi:MAG: permease prefix domain 1-containing protein [Kineosporiaceae bacterium]
MDDVADEAGDHLREHTDRLVAQGIAPESAQRETLDRFGDVTVVVRAFALTADGLPAVPPRLTRAAGVAGLGAGAAWAGSAVVAVAGGHTDVLVPWSLARYELWTVLLVLAVAMTTFTIAGVLARTGQLRSASGVTKVFLGVMLTAATVPLGWAVTTLAGVLGAAVLVALRGPGVDEVVAAPALRWLSVWPAGAAALWLLDEVYPIGRTDEYGDHPLAWLTPLLVCTLCSAIALARTGSGPRAEAVADLGGSSPASLAPASG